MKQEKASYKNIYRRMMRFALVTIFMVSIFGAVAIKTASAEDGCMHLADMPLEVRGQEAPPLVNIVWDASGSMVWSFFTDQEDGLYWIGNTGYAYVFPERNNYYGTNSNFGRELHDYRRNHWQTQSSSYNYMYYNPDSTYEPWPRWNELKTPDEADPHADIDEPRYHPMEPDYTFDLNADFYHFSVDSTSSSETVTLSITSENLTGNWSLWNGIYETYYYSGRSAIWNTDELDPTETYNVEIFIPSLWNYDNYDRSEYTVIMDENEYPELTLESAGSGWKKLEDSSGPVEFQFPTGNGSIRLDPKSNGWQCADDVRFVPVNQQDGKVIFAHYFTENENGVFLINLDGEITYYEAVLGSNQNTVDYLIPMTAAEAAEAGIVTGRTYLEERQNFADWYQFYRRRYFTGIAAAGTMINEWSDVFIRITSYPHYYSGWNFFRRISPIDVTIEDLDGTEHHYDEKDDVLAEWYGMSYPWGGTSLRRGLFQAGQFFETGSSDDWSGDRWGNIPDDSPFKEYSRSDYYPYFMPEFGGECQQAFAIVMTDGMWNDTQFPYNVGNTDRDGASEFAGGVFDDHLSNTAADVAMHFYHRDLRENMNNLVPPSDADQATHQHMVTYAISFGIPGRRFTAEERQIYGEDLRYGNEPEAWQGWHDSSTTLSDIRGSTETIDDLWHSTVNARGEFYSASEPDELIQALTDIRTAIDARRGTASAVAASTVERRVGSLLYQGEYNPNRWSGELFAREIDVDTGEVVGTKWSASEELSDKDADDRIIFTYDGNGEGIVFNASLSDPPEDEDPIYYLSDLSEDQINYLRGDRSLEIQNDGSFRNRNSKLGDIVHSQPMYHDGVVYVGANDGMLHAFDAQTGEELFAYIPGIVHENLHKLTDPSYRYQYFVNGEPIVRNIWEDDTRKAILVGGLRQGGKGYYALDITKIKSAFNFDGNDDTSGFNASEFVKWEFTADDDNDMGYSFSRPHIMNTKAAGWVALFGNGYNSVNEKAVLFIVSLSDGSVVKKFDTGVGGCNGIVGGVSPVDTNSDGYGNIVYAVDLKGNLWKFDLNDENSDNWEIAYNGEPLFTAQNEDGDTQPITSRPEVMRHCDHLGFLVIFGTGKHVSELDFGNTETQSIYGIWDWQEAWEYREDNEEEAGDDKYFGTFTTGRSLSALSGDLSDLTLLQQEVTSTVTHEGHEYLFLSSNEIQWWDPAAESPSGEEEHVGWYLDLPEPGERVTINPIISGGRVYIAASIPTLSPCVSGGESTFYALDACTGGASSPSFFPEIDGETPSARRFEIPIVGLTRRPGNVPLVTTREGVEEVFEEEGRVRGIMYWHPWDN